MSVVDRPSTALVARGLGKQYGTGPATVTALQECDFTLDDGEIVAIVGPSGSGKSTLLHLLAGLDMPTHGSVSAGGRIIAAMSEATAAAWRAAEVGFVLQRDNLIPALTLRENVAAPLMFAGLGQRAALARADVVLDSVGLAHRRHAIPAEVSGGEAQRAAVARACGGTPRFVFADEPTGALDRAAGERVIELLKASVRDAGAGAVIVTHDTQVAAIADRVVHIEDGRLHS